LFGRYTIARCGILSSAASSNRRAVIAERSVYESTYFTERYFMMMESMKHLKPLNS